MIYILIYPTFPEVKIQFANVPHVRKGHLLNRPAPSAAAQCGRVLYISPLCPQSYNESALNWEHMKSKGNYRDHGMGLLGMFWIYYIYITIGGKNSLGIFGTVLDDEKHIYAQKPRRKPIHIWNGKFSALSQFPWPWPHHTPLPQGPAQKIRGTSQ